MAYVLSSEIIFYSTVFLFFLILFPFLSLCTQRGKKILLYFIFKIFHLFYVLILKKSLAKQQANYLLNTLL